MVLTEGSDPIAPLAELSRRVLAMNDPNLNTRSSTEIKVSRRDAQAALRQVVHGHATGEALRAVRLRDGAEIVSHVRDWAGGLDEAGQWYGAQPIPAPGGRSAEAMVMSGQAALVREHLDHLAQGGHA